MTIITVTQDGKTTTEIFSEDQKGTDESIKYLEKVKEKHFHHPNSYLFSEIEKCKKLIYKNRSSYKRKRPHARKAGSLECDRERYFKQELENCKPPKLIVKIEHLYL